VVVRPPPPRQVVRSWCVGEPWPDSRPSTFPLRLNPDRGVNRAAVSRTEDPKTSATFPPNGYRRSRAQRPPFRRRTCVSAMGSRRRLSPAPFPDRPRLATLPVPFDRTLRRVRAVPSAPEGASGSARLRLATKAEGFRRRPRALPDPVRCTLRRCGPGFPAAPCGASGASAASRDPAERFPPRLAALRDPPPSAPRRFRWRRPSAAHAASGLSLVSRRTSAPPKRARPPRGDCSAAVPPRVTPDRVRVPPTERSCPPPCK